MITQFIKFLAIREMRVLWCMGPRMFQKMIILIALCPIFYTWGMTPKEQRTHEKYETVRYAFEKKSKLLYAFEIRLKL